MKVLKRITAITGIVVLLLILVAWILAVVYEDDVKKLVLNELNQHLTTEIEVKDIDLTLLEKFPYASLRFTDILAKDATSGQKKDSLLYAHKLFLQFNLFDLFSEHYTLKKVSAETGVVKLRVRSDGTVNYHFWKDDTTSSDNAFTIDLKQVNLSGLRFEYTHAPSAFGMMFHVDESTVSGQVSNNGYTAHLKCDLFLNDMYSDTTHILRDRDISINTGLDVRNQEVYTFKRGKLKVDELEWQDIQVTYTDKEGHTPKLEATGKGTDLPWNALLKSLPVQVQNVFNGYETDGLVDVHFNLAGRLGKGQNLRLDAEYMMKEGTLALTGSPVRLSNLQVEGTLAYMAEGGPANNVFFKSVRASLEGDALTGRGVIENFEQPHLQCTVEGALDLSHLPVLIRMDTVESLHGHAGIHLNYNGPINSPHNMSPDEWKQVVLLGTASLQNVALSLKGSKHTLSDVNGKLILRNPDLSVDSLHAMLNNTRIDMNGVLRNFMGYVLYPDQDLNIEGRVTSPLADLNDLLKSDVSKAATPYLFALPDHVNMNVDMNIGEVVFRRFKAANVNGKLRMENRVLYADLLSMQTMGGTIELSGSADNRSRDHVDADVQSSIRNIQVKYLFYQAENFGQDLLRDEHLQGKMSARVSMQSTWSDHLDLDPAKLRAHGSVKVENGELIDFKPMLSLSRFIKVSELEHIRFSTLENEVDIHDQTVFIPLMDIKSSALNVSASGSHTFDNKIDYHFRVRLSDLLSRKARKAKKENDEYGVVEDDGLGRTSLYISMTGTADNPEIKYDQQGVREKIREDLKKEKQNLKSILHDEFRFLHKDTIPKTPPKKEKKEFEIEWE
ncbi:MAG: hypothetical protein H6585_00320 [Flavobacteriales bacterium]|nr:hypothetical protein [Flavobacteriales bacterium]MCB9446769.1 hypothetical protein [Flavobacteriales bacterium]